MHDTINKPLPYEEWVDLNLMNEAKNDRAGMFCLDIESNIASLYEEYLDEFRKTKTPT